MRVCGKCNPADLSRNKFNDKICFYCGQICDIIMGMKKRRNLLLISAFATLVGGAAHANWEYPGYYVGDGAYTDDGSRFTVSVRGGASFGFGSIKNEIGELTPLYYSDGTVLLSELAYEQGRAEGLYDDFSPVGYVNIGELPPTKDYESFTFAAGASVGWTVPNRPQWRIELGWDHISESEYNASPFLEGEAELMGTEQGGQIALISSGAVQSSVTTDIISVMAFYDFFDGVQKPMRTVIPYIGFGAGYADIKTILNMSDLYGDLSLSPDLYPYGQKAETLDPIQFYRSERNNSNIAALFAVGMSYGMTENMYFDFGARIAYIPRIRWELSNEDNTLHRDWFSSENTIYANIMFGIRFEF